MCFFYVIFMCLFIQYFLRNVYILSAKAQNWVRRGSVPTRKPWPPTGCLWSTSNSLYPKPNASPAPWSLLHTPCVHDLSLRYWHPRTEELPLTPSSHSPTATSNHLLSLAVFSTSDLSASAPGSPVCSQSPCTRPVIRLATLSPLQGDFLSFVLMPPTFCGPPWGPGSHLLILLSLSPRGCLASCGYSINACWANEWVKYSLKMWCCTIPSYFCTCFFPQFRLLFLLQGTLFLNTGNPHLRECGRSVRNCLLRLSLPPGLIPGALQMFSVANCVLSLNDSWVCCCNYNDKSAEWGVLEVCSKHASLGAGMFLNWKEEINRSFLRFGFIFIKWAFPAILRLELAHLN